MKLSGLGEQFDGGRDVIVRQEGAHVLISVDATQGSDSGVAMLTPSQARILSTSLRELADSADQIDTS